MSLKEELLTWNEACAAYDAEDFDKALSMFDQIADSAKIYFNIGTVLATLQEHESAIKAFIDAVKADQYFAVAYFQKGVSNFLLGDFEAAVEDFNDTLQYLRGNLLIDYKQLGLDYKLFSCEVLYNRGLCYLFMGEDEAGTADLYDAQKEKQSADHDVIDQAIEEGIDGLSVFSLPPGLLFRPASAKVKNANKVDYLGSSKLIAAVERTDMFTGFKGAYIRKATNVTAGTDMTSAPASMLTRAATVRTPQSNGSSLAPKRSLNSGPRRRSRSFESSSQAPNMDEYMGSEGRGRGGGGDSYGGGPAGYRAPSAGGLPSRGTSISRRTSSASSARFAQGPRPPRPPPSEIGRGGGDTASSYGGSSYGGSQSGNVLRVKCHYNDTLVVVCDLNVTFSELVSKIQQKYNSPKPLRLKYKDEDQELVLMTDDDDLEFARSIVRRPDRLDVWCFD